MYVAPNRPAVRVLLGTPYLLDSATGVGAFARSLAKGLRAAGDEVTAVEPNIGTAGGGFANLRLAWTAAAHLFRTKRMVDVVHCQQLHMQSLSLGALGRVLGKRVVLTVHGRSPTPRGFRGLAFRTVETLCARLPNRLVVVARSLSSRVGREVLVIPNGVAVRDIAATRNAREDARRALGLQNSFVILFLGRVTKDKGVLNLLDAFDVVLSSQKTSARLLLVGPADDELRREIERHSRAAGGAIIFLGFREDPWRHLAAADLFVLPSMREGLPLSLLEAMAAGVPVVSSNVGDIPEVVEHGVTGLLVPPGNSPALAEAILWVLGHRAEAKLLATAAFERVASRYDIARVVDSYRDLYTQVLTAR